LVNNTYLGHHPAPSDDVGVNLLPRLLLVSDNGLEQAVQVLVPRFIVLLERVKALGQVGAQPRCVVPLHGAVTEVELMILVVREAGELLPKGGRRQRERVRLVFSLGEVGRDEALRG